MQKEELTSQTKKSQEEGYVHIIPDSFCVGTKTMPDKASVRTWERWFRRNFCKGARLRRADL